jgi:uncharacterized protein YcbK (DUF882 family)
VGSFALQIGASVGFLLAFSLVVPSTTETAVANGDTRTLHLVHANTHEAIDATFRVNGAYDPAVLKQLNWFLRDWRRDEQTTMDPRLFDIVWEVYRSAGAESPIVVYSGYRSPSTNAMLRRRSRAVAEHSQHMLGKAMDTTMPGMPMEKIREIGMRLQRGGVGYYQTSNFVHLDVGSVRSWPRMSYDQLARLFPDGKTVHIAADGRTLGRYEEARAEIEAGGGAAWAPPAQQSKGFFAWLLGGSKEDDDEEEAAQAAAPARRGAGRTQVASLARQTTPGAAPLSSGVEEDGGRNFFIEEQNRASRRVAATPPRAAAPAPSPVLVQASAAETEPTKAAIEPTATIAPPPDAAPRPKPAADAAPPASAGAPQPAPRAIVAAAFVPAVLPPRRPADLVATAAPVPLPPIRPTLVATAMPPPATRTGSRPAEAQLASATTDPIATLLAGDGPAPAPATPAPRMRLPVEITQGFSGRRASAETPRDVLAYAQPAPVQGLRTAANQPPPPPAATADLAPTVVPARLDRSNFAFLTSVVAVKDAVSQASLAPTVASLRQSARMVAALFSSELSASGYAARFGAAATVAASHFTGSAVEPLPTRPELIVAKTGPDGN